MSIDKSLDTLTKAERMLAEVASAPEAMHIIDMAEAARVWAQRAKLGTASINHATAIKLKAEIRLADCVDEGQKHGAIATRKDGGPKNHVIRDDMVLPSTYEELGISRNKVHEARKIRDAFTPEAIDEIVESANLQDKEIARKEFVQQRAHVSYNGGGNEWYTPTVFVDAARRAMGSIDTDPASNPTAQEWIQARKFFTKDESGLEQEWVGNVWLNPPYAQPLISDFCEKVVEEFNAGRVQQAVVLVNNATETKWGQRLLSNCTAVCLPSGRIKYLDESASPKLTPLQGQMFVYFGSRQLEFAKEFAAFGVTLCGWSTA
jgi:hypothetical protein